MPREQASTKGRTASVICLCICLSCAGTARANARIYQHLLRSTGWVVVPSADGASAGTCFIVDRQHRLAITCAHVIGQASEALVYFPQYRGGEAIVEADYDLNHVPALVGQVIARDSARDLALIELGALPSDVQELPLAPRSPEPGEAVHSIGNSGLADRGMLWRYTRGSVRLVYPERLRTASGVMAVRMVETQSPVNKGDSGGPVVNDRGELVGVARAYATLERLVSENTDVLEVKKFLKSNQARQTPVNVRRPASIVGTWDITALAEDGVAVRGQARLAGDETFVFSLKAYGGGHKIKRGRYAYANGILWLLAANMDLSVPLTWRDAEHFTFRTRKVEFNFERQKTSAAADPVQRQIKALTEPHFADTQLLDLGAAAAALAFLSCLNYCLSRFS
jgi:S1-C subfamily serine protease